MKQLYPDPATFFATLHEIYQRAESLVGGAIERTYAIGGHTMCLRFAGPALVPLLTPALEHLATAAQIDSADLTVCLWDSASTRTTPPIRSWSELQPGVRGEVPRYSDGRHLTAVQVNDGILSILNRERNLALYWVPRNVLPVYEWSAPLKVLLHWWLRDRGYLMIHSGAVGLDCGAALLVGQTGTGKSTAALSCLSAGMQYIADDRCLITLEPEPAAHAIYNSGKVAPEQTRRFPHLLPAFSRPLDRPSEKSLLFVLQCAQAQVARYLPIKAILLARLAHHEQTSLEPVKATTVLRVLATSTMMYAPGWSQDDLNWMAKLVERVPCYQINLGTDLEGVPPVISRVIGDGTAGTVREDPGRGHPDSSLAQDQHDLR